MTVKGISGQLIEILHHSSPQRVQVDIANQLQKVGLLLAQNRFISILEQVAPPSVPAVIGHRIAGKQSPHDGRDLNASRAQRQMEMIG